MNDERTLGAEIDGGNRRVVVAIATPLEPELVGRLRAGDERIHVLYEPDLLPPTRYPGDHQGVEAFTRTPEQERRWQALLAHAEVLFGLPADSSEGLAQAVRTNPELRWVQGTAGGTGQQVRAAGLTRDELHRVTITSARGVHAGPLAEFAMLGVLAFAKDLPRLLADARERRWDHYPMAELAGRTLLLIGLGTIGRAIARAAQAFGMRVVAVTKSGFVAVGAVDEIATPDALIRLLPHADAIVVTLPLTPETRGLMGAEAFANVRRGAIFVNVGRGAVVDEDSLVSALRDGRLSGAALDVFSTEPLPPDSPLWSMRNVLLSPHTAALSIHENERIVELFAENLRRYLGSQPLENVIKPGVYY